MRVSDFFSLAIVVIVGMAGAWLVGAVREARNAAIASQAHSPLNQLTLAFHNYHDVYGCLPPAYIADEDGTPLHSWRVLILPYIDGKDLYDAYDFSEPWNGPNNSRLAHRMSQIFHCPSEPKSDSLTNYVVIVGEDTPFPGARSTSFEDFRDGMGNTILLAEIANSDISWLEPRDLNAAEMSFRVNDPDKPSISSSRRKGPYVTFANGIRCYWVSDSLRPETLKALTTIAGGEEIAMANVADVGLTSLGSGPASDAQLDGFDQWANVHDLWLVRANVTDDGLANLRQATELSKLYLTDIPITDDGLPHLVKGRNSLYSLDLSGTQITDAGLVHLKSLYRVYFVNLKRTTVTFPAVLELLAYLPDGSISFSEGRVGSQTINLSGSTVTDDDLKLLSEFTKLQNLDLSQTGITDRGLEFLHALTTLKHLNLTDAEVTDAGVERLRQALPDLKIR
jgi:hypothetical protein